MLSGIRLLDKSRSGCENLFRIEIWTKFDSTMASMVNDLKSHLETEYIQMMIDDPNTRPSNSKINDHVAAEWINSFSNHSKN